MNDIKRDVWQPLQFDNKDQPTEIIFTQGKFITCSKYGRVMISNNGYGHEEVTAADMFYLMKDTVKHLQAKLAEARRPWWRKALEKLK